MIQTMNAKIQSTNAMIQTMNAMIQRGKAAKIQSTNAMIQSTKKSLSGWAALAAAGALIASVLAAGAGRPAGAVTDRADHATRLSACVGDAAADRMFTDVSAGHAFRTAINCIAYYGITEGTGGSTYSPEQDVTRAQMAVFIARAAEVAGADLGPGPASDAGFDDIADTWQEAQDAINRLASNGMIPSGGTYRPDDAITRAEMATFLIGLLVEAAPDVTRDSSGTILLGVAGSRSVADDRFPDTGSPEIPETAALYELGVTRGASPAATQDDTMPPLDFNYEPGGTVDRGQMAAFITRALAHTPVRPAGVSAQYDGADVIVSVRDAAYRPVSGAAVDVFWAASDHRGQAVSADGACRLSVVAQADASSYPCEIDGTDPVTGDDGDARVAVTGLRRVPAGGATVWAWTGQDGATGATVAAAATQDAGTVAAGTELFVFDVAEGADIGYATATLVATSFNARKVPFGSSVLYTMHLQDVVGDVPTGVNGTDPAQWSLTVRVPGRDPDVRTLVSGPTGRASFPISVNDPTPGTPDGDLTVTFTLAAADNAPSATVDSNGQPAAEGTLTFSDEAPSIASGSATVTIDTRRYVPVTGGAASNTATVTVLDQYGHPFPGARVSLSSSLPGVSPGGGGDFTVDRSGAHRFSYQYSGSDGATETLTASHGVDTVSPSNVTETVYWAADAGPDNGDTARAVLAGDVRRRHIVADDGTGPVLLVYDGNDRFDLRGAPASMAAFEAELAAALGRDTPGVSLAWSNYLAGSDGRVTEYDLSAS